MASFVLLSCRLACSCGIDWKEPQSHFPGVDYVGNASIVKRIAELDVGRSIPIFVVFGSEIKAVSPYVGYGWKLPFLESKIVQIDENSFSLEQPDGWSRTFWRDRSNPNLLHGQGNWKALVKGDTITAWADCGTKIVFNAGKISSLETGGKILNYAYQNGRVYQVRDGNSIVLEVVSDARGDVSGLRAGGGQISFKLGEMPAVENVNGQNLVAGIRKALCQIESPTLSEAIEYGVDAQLNPKIRVGGSRNFTWNAVTGKILRDGDWTYEIPESKGLGDNIPIARSNSLGERQSWFRDSAKGEVTTEQGGVTTKVTSFTSGLLNGKVKKIRSTKGDQVVHDLRMSYDEGGRLLKVQDNAVVERFTYNQSGQLVEKRRNETLILQRNHNGSTYEDVYVDGSRKTYTPKPEGVLINSVAPDGTTSERFVMDSNASQKEFRNMRETVRRAIDESNYLSLLKKYYMQ